MIHTYNINQSAASPVPDLVHLRPFSDGLAIYYGYL